MSEAEVVTIPVKEYEKIKDRLAKGRVKDVLSVSDDVKLEPREKLLVYGVWIGITLSGMNKRAWGVAFTTSCLAVAVLFLVLGLSMY